MIKTCHDQCYGTGIHIFQLMMKNEKNIKHQTLKGRFHLSYTVLCTTSNCYHSQCNMQHSTGRWKLTLKIMIVILSMNRDEENSE